MEEHKKFLTNALGKKNKKNEGNITFEDSMAQNFLKSLNKSVLTFMNPNKFEVEMLKYNC